MDINKINIVILLLIFMFNLSSQNLVRDGGFEDYKKCPQGVTRQISDFKLKNWYIPTKGTTDYFNRCSIKKWVNIPANDLGYQDTHSGNGYVGFLSAILGNEREYIQSELIEPLINGEEYHVEFWVSLADYSMYAIGQIGVFFSTEKLTSNNAGPLNVTPQIFAEKPILDTANWVKISGIYKASGGEKYLTIGSFSTNKKDFVKTGRKKYPKQKAAYYFIEDVIVKPLEEKNLINNVVQIKLNTPIILQNITFETGKSTLKSSSFNELDSLVNLLQRNPTYKIKITGHTDDVGKEEDNLKLSEDRAKAVANYLIEKGILKERITYKGLGSSKPISREQTEESRSKNRRVEFTIIQ
ncbi:MAG: hypothetical protein Kow0079_18110 [Vicingaceae bacterium]